MDVVVVVVIPMVVLVEELVIVAVFLVTMVDENLYNTRVSTSRCLGFNYKESENLGKRNPRG